MERQHTPCSRIGLRNYLKWFLNLNLYYCYFYGNSILLRKQYQKMIFQYQFTQFLFLLQFLLSWTSKFFFGHSYTIPIMCFWYVYSEMHILNLPFWISVFNFIFLCVYLSVFISLSLSFCLHLSVSISLPLSVCLCPFISVSLSLC